MCYAVRPLHALCGVNSAMIPLGKHAQPASPTSNGPLQVMYSSRNAESM